MPFATLDALDGDVRFEFDERISERVSGGTLNTAVTVSPRGGEVRVKHSRRALAVSLADGFLPGTVYRVTLNATVSDMFGNRLQDPFELVFSTGEAPVPTTLAGEIWNRVTGSALAEAVVIATDSEGRVHQARTDRAGIFAMRYVPGGPLLVQAFEDNNRNTLVDSTEVQGQLAVELAAGDTLLVDLPVLEPDTSAAVVAEAEALDSVTVVVEFDDYLDPSRGAEGLTVQIARPGGVAVEVARLFDEAGYAAFVTEVTDSLARLDSIDAANAVPPPPVVPADSAVAGDTVAVVGDTTAVGPAREVIGRPAAPGRPGQDAPAGRRPPTRLDPLQGERPGPTRDGRRVLPGRRIVVVVTAPVEVDVEYEVTVTGAVNINGLAGGGGSTTLVREAPEPAARSIEGVDTLAVDTLAVDTLAVDTLAVDPLVVAALAGDTRAADTLAVAALAVAAQAGDTLAVRALAATTPDGTEPPRGVPTVTGTAARPARVAAARPSIGR